MSEREESLRRKLAAEIEAYEARENIASSGRPSMSDLTERLRANRHMGTLAREAADRIDELEQALREMMHSPATRAELRGMARRALEALDE